MLKKEYISLLNLDLSQNKWRMYKIEITFPDQHFPFFVVKLSWGRMNSYHRSQIHSFEEEGKMHRFLEQTLKRRKRHGYRVFEKSDGFPASPTLQEFEFAGDMGQLLLF